VSIAGFDAPSAPTAANGLVFVGTSDGHVFAIDARGLSKCSQAGAIVCLARWYTSVGRPAGPPVVVNGRVYVPTDDGAVHVFGENPAASLGLRRGG